MKIGKKAENADLCVFVCEDIHFNKHCTIDSHFACTVSILMMYEWIAAVLRSAPI